MPTRSVRFTRGPGTDELERAYAMADAMTVRALRSREPERGGRVQAAMSPWEGVAQLGEAWIANRMHKNARELAAADQERTLAANDALIRQLSGEKAPQYAGERAGTSIRMPEDLDTGRPMMLSDRAQALAAATGGLDPRQANQVMSGAVLERQLRGPQVERVDLGDRIAILEDGREVGSIPKGATPDAALRERGENQRFEGVSGSAKYSGDITMRGQDIGASTARRGQDVTMRGQDLTYDAAMRGNQATADRYANEQRIADERKAAAAQEGIGKADRVMAEVERAIGLTGPRSAGLIGEATREWGPLGGAGTQARDLEAAVQTVKANLGFDELQKMRQASPTGGALGQVAVQELVALQATVANLDTAQDPATLKANLEKIYTHYGNWKRTLQGNLPGSGSWDEQGGPSGNRPGDKYLQGGQ